MANANFFSPDGGITRYPLEDTEARNRIDNNFQLLRDGEVIEGKNKLEITGSSSYTEGGVTFVVNSDKSVTVDTNGVASSTNARFVLQMPIKHLVNGEEYVISGTPNDIDGTKAYVGISDWDTTNYDDTTGEGAEFTMFNPESYPNARIYIYVKSGTTLSNKVFEPMICTLEEWNKSHSYEPYYVPLKERKLDITDEQVLGAWNLASGKFTSEVVNAITFTVNSNNVVTINGHSSISSGGSHIYSTHFIVKKGSYYFSSGNALDDLTFMLRDTSDNIVVRMNAPDNEIYFTFNEDKEVYMDLSAGYTKTFSGNTIYPMISLKPNTPYVPYVMTNRELTEKVQIKHFEIVNMNTDDDGLLTLPSVSTDIALLPSRITVPGGLLMPCATSISGAGKLLIQFFNKNTAQFVATSVTVNGTLNYIEL